MYLIIYCIHTYVNVYVMLPSFEMGGMREDLRTYEKEGCMTGLYRNVSMGRWWGWVEGMDKEGEAQCSIVRCY